LILVKFFTSYASEQNMTEVGMVFHGQGKSENVKVPAFQIHNNLIRKQRISLLRTWINSGRNSLQWKREK